MVNFGIRLKELRLKAGLTQKQLADRLGLTKSVISYYELIERYPSPDILVKLSTIFGVTTDYLLGLEARPTIDVSGLDENDIDLLRHTVEVLRMKNKK
ncbi:MAG: helix-turn-helix transcriptional regulator [Ruminococcus sp.]|nr:helix-turn-helix transcriptional regulator [Ruminococcus sp.]